MRQNKEDRAALSYIGGEFQKLNARLDRIEHIMKSHFRSDVKEVEMTQADIDAASSPTRKD